MLQATKKIGREKRKGKLSGLFVWLAVLAGLALADEVVVTPQEILPGEQVKFDILTPRGLSELQFRVLSPAGKEYLPRLSPKESGGFVAVFADTFDQGFLSDGWNEYRAQLCDVRGRVIAATPFHLSSRAKTLYFTLYIDDVGAGGLPSEKELNWYRQAAGPINFGYQCDDIGCMSLQKIQKKFGGGRDYIFHHFHPYEFVGPPLLKRIDSLLNWYKWHYRLNEAIARLTGNRVRIRDRHFFGLLLLFSALWFIIYLRKRSRVIRLALFFSLGLLFIFLLASQAANSSHREENLRIRIDDTEWCKDFLRKTKRLFAAHGLVYPRVTRHGWNLPPAGLNEFYLAEMNVLADASAIRRDKGSALQPIAVGQRMVEWRETALPYYTKKGGDLNSVWDGAEETRGLLEMPLALDNVSAYGFSNEQRALIDQLPSGALVSTFVHPGNSIRKLEPVLSYLQSRSAVQFVSTLEYLDIFMRHYPRPVLLDLDQKTGHWAYLDKTGLKTIAETTIVGFQDGDLEFRIDVKTVSPTPLLGLISLKTSRLEFDGQDCAGIERENASYFEIKDVSPGEHAIRLSPNRAVEKPAS